MKINIYKSDTNTDHLVLVVDWPQDITGDMVDFLKKISVIDGDSIKPEKANAVAFKLTSLDEENERGLKLSIINTIRQSLTQISSTTQPIMPEQGIFLTKEQITSILVDLQTAKHENVFLKQKSKVYDSEARSMYIIVGTFFVVTVLAIIICVISLFTKH